MVEGNSLAQYGQVLSQKYSITARPRTSSSETGLPPSAASLNGAGRWSPSGVTWNAESRSSRPSFAPPAAARLRRGRVRRRAYGLMYA
jgi:hypothetical protein